MVKPSNLVRERAVARAGAAYLLKVDVSQFYPSLYTHAIGWAIDPQLRKRDSWHKKQFLGKKLDAAIMNLQGKISQGVPIGNDISFLLAEIVLGQVDRKLNLPPARCYRWYDDYEIACDSKEEAEATLARLSAGLHAFRLRANPRKTVILELPRPANDEWQAVLRQRGSGSLARATDMVQYFDAAFRLRDQFPAAPVLMYALGLLFRLNCPSDEAGRVAQSAITQALLCEPGAAQKAFALLTFWRLNGFQLDLPLIGSTVERVVLRHRASGFTSDVAWCLAFCIENHVSLGPAAGKVLAVLDDDCITLQALHAHAEGLLPKGFTTAKISRELQRADMDGEHWLVAYESVRQGFMTASARAVKNNALFADLLKQRVAFYRTSMPPYASVVHTGGAPDWILALWMDTLRGRRKPKEKEPTELRIPALQLLTTDLARLAQHEGSHDDTVHDLLDLYEDAEFADLMATQEPYF